MISNISKFTEPFNLKDIETKVRTQGMVGSLNGGFGIPSEKCTVPSAGVRQFPISTWFPAIHTPHLPFPSRKVFPNSPGGHDTIFPRVSNSDAAISLHSEPNRSSSHFESRTTELSRRDSPVRGATILGSPYWLRIYFRIYDHV